MKNLKEISFISECFKVKNCIEIIYNLISYCWVWESPINNMNFDAILENMY